jgi:hydroxymethylglutaryl-CoA reductase (NADPH)
MAKKPLAPRGYDQEAMLARQRWLKEAFGIEYKSDSITGQPENYQGLVENMIGGMNFPISMAAPLEISKGDGLNGQFVMPLATVEGTLVLSMTRGMYVSALSGGVETVHIGQGLARSPAFVFDDIFAAKQFMVWVKDHFALLKQAAESTTRFGKLKSIMPLMLQNTVILDCMYTTGDAAGQNMVTIATEALLKAIAEHSDVPKFRRFYIESNFSGDKNCAHRNLILGRGHKSIARARISDKVMRRFMRISVDDAIDAAHVKQEASIAAGMQGVNLHAANALAAIYLATGQDIACVVENANALVRYEKVENELEVTVTMPSMSIGTIGGATRLPQQKRHLEMMGCHGLGGAKKFAQLIAGSVLALELSLGAAIVSNEFAEAHATYGRKA